MMLAEVLTTNFNRDLSQLADRFGIRVQLLEQLQQEMIPFNADYKRPFDVFRYFSKRQEVVRNGADYRWVIKTGEFLEHDCGSDCGKAASKYAFALRDNQSEFMEELYSA